MGAINPKEDYTNIPHETFDAVIVGGGGSGMRASYQLAQAGLKVAVLTKVFPTRSHTVAAQGGIGASLGNMQEDNWHYHFYDTVKGSDWLGDQDAIEFMTREAPQVVYELEHLGMPFDRNADGTIYQRPFGGHSANYGEKAVPRACAAADRTGHALLHTLYQSNVKMGTQFFVEWIALDLIRNEKGDVFGVTAIDQETGKIAVFQAKATLFATGGAGRVYRASTNAYINTGDGLGMAARAGIPLQDMEFWQFHPTGVAGAGVLLTEGCRGEGAILRNKDGEPFMERYAPTLKDLAPRDFVSRSMDQEIKEGRGCGPKGDYILLDMTHLGADTIMKRLPSVFEIGKKFANVDITKEPIPVVPTIHYQMGGIPTNIHGQVVVPESRETEALVANYNKDTDVYSTNAEGRDFAKPVKGFYAIGECSCVSVHGANRLGTNSLLDLVVFGKAAGQHIIEYVTKQHDGEYEPLPTTVLQETVERIRKLDESTTGENAQDVADAIRDIVQDHAGVFRTSALLDEGVKQILAIEPRVRNIHLKDKSKVFNTARIEALEVENLYEVAKATLISAAARKECRGAHTVVDFEESPDHAEYPYGRRDDEWMKHTLWFSADNRLEYKPVRYRPLSVDAIPPKPRTF
ncbi:FAD-binding protein [Acinetobacter lwoffii]|uniref:FAD-binding protein n=1 Tax=Acinetobacter lwoffii TaxID=28090 RepID=UPI003525BD84